MRENVRARKFSAGVGLIGRINYVVRRVTTARRGNGIFRLRRNRRFDPPAKTRGGTPPPSAARFNWLASLPGSWRDARQTADGGEGRGEFGEAIEEMIARAMRTYFRAFRFSLFSRGGGGRAGKATT